MTAPARLALGVLGLLTTTTAVFARIAPPTRPGAPGSEEPPPARMHLGPGSTSRRLPKMRRIVSGWPAEGSVSASAKTRGSPSTTTTPRGTRPCRRASTHAAGCMQP